MIYDIFEGLIQSYDGDVGYALDTLRNLYKEIKHDHKSFLFDLKFFIEDTSEELNLCPECGERLRTATSRERHTELDYNEIENFYNSVCDNCGWDNFD